MPEQWSSLVSLVMIVGFLSWALFHAFLRSDAPKNLAIKWAGTLILLGLGIPIAFAFLRAGGHAAGFGLPITTLVIGVPLGIIWASSWGSLLASPLTSLFDGGEAYQRSVPLYAIAEARQKRGDYPEAVKEVEKQLTKFPGDLTGTLLLADLQAKDLKDMGAAQAAVESYLEHGPHPPKNTFLALSHLAELYLSQAHDRQNAQRCLERSQRLCLGTKQEMIAAQRLAHLTSDDFLEARNEPRRIPVKASDRRLGLRKEPVRFETNEKSPEILAQECIEQLNKHPLDLETREQLALLYANHYRRLDMAIEQLETMIQFRNQTPKNIVRWLNLMADLHIRLAASVSDARHCLERIGQRFPNTAHEAQAQKRIQYLRLEKKGRHP